MCKVGRFLGVTHAPVGLTGSHLTFPLHKKLFSSDTSKQLCSLSAPSTVWHPQIFLLLFLPKQEEEFVCHKLQQAHRALCTSMRKGFTKSAMSLHLLICVEQTTASSNNPCEMLMLMTRTKILPNGNPRMTITLTETSKKVCTLQSGFKASFENNLNQGQKSLDHCCFPKFQNLHALPALVQHRPTNKLKIW